MDPSLTAMPTMLGQVCSWIISYSAEAFAGEKLCTNDWLAAITKYVRHGQNENIRQEIAVEEEIFLLRRKHPVEEETSALASQ